MSRRWDGPSRARLQSADFDQLRSTPRRWDIFIALVCILGVLHACAGQFTPYNLTSMALPMDTGSEAKVHIVRGDRNFLNMKFRDI